MTTPKRASRRSIVSYAKEAERMVARKLGGVRVISDGKRHRPDVDGGWFVAEVKQRRIPTWILAAMKQATLASRVHRAYPWPLLVLVDKPGRGKPGRMLIVVDPDDWIEWQGKGNPP